MCGIFGLVADNIDGAKLKRLTDTLSHRGPDDSGTYLDSRAGLGHRRLSIIDLEGGHQPISNEDNSLHIVFNGEIYNFSELRDELIKKGHRFSTRSDTETILHGYEEWGERCVERLRGMFAFAIWDAKAKRLFIARDRLGIKPLFYAHHAGRFYFSSEMKAILADEGFPRKMDDAALASYFTLSYIPAPLTIYAGIRKLLPGHTLTFEAGKIRISKYWDLTFAPEHGKGEDHFIKGFMDLLNESVKLHLASEVPLGAFLSGGVDSSAIVALMSGFGDVNTFCIGFGGERGGYLDERVYARMLAERYSTKHHEYEVKPDPQGIVERIVSSFDEPFADDSAIPSFFVCKMARQNVTVTLSGLGGDELFAGYERYLGFRLRSMYAKVPRLLRENVFAKIALSLPERADGHYTINHLKRFVRSGAASAGEAYFDFMSKLDPRVKGSFFSDQKRFAGPLDACRELVLGHFNSQNVHGKPDSLDRALYCDIKTYLPEDILAVTDRMSMQNSLEVRVPFIDHRVVEFCAKIPPSMLMKGFKKKYLLKKAVSGLLPEEVISHRKQGFVGPMSMWLRTDLKDFVMETLSEKNLSRHGLLNTSIVNRVLDEHFRGKEIHDTLIWSLIVFQKWHDIYIEGRGPSLRAGAGLSREAALA